MNQTLIKDVRFQRVKRRREGRYKLPGAVEVGLADTGGGCEIFVRSRKEPGEIGFNENVLVNERLLSFEECFQLGFCESTVNDKLTKSLALLTLQVKQDELKETGKIGNPDPGK